MMIQILIVAIACTLAVAPDEPTDGDAPSSAPELVLRSGDRIPATRVLRSGNRVVVYLPDGRAVAYAVEDVDLAASRLGGSRGAAPPEPAPERPHSLVELAGRTSLDISETAPEPEAIVLVGRAPMTAPAIDEEPGTEDEEPSPTLPIASGDERTTPPEEHAWLSSAAAAMAKTLTTLEREAAKADVHCKAFATETVPDPTTPHQRRPGVGGRTMQCLQALNAASPLINHLARTDPKIKERARRESISPGELRRAYSAHGISDLQNRLRRARETIHKYSPER